MNVHKIRDIFVIYQILETRHNNNDNENVDNVVRYWYKNMKSTAEDNTRLQKESTR